MVNYLALLRGINVGGNNSIKMEHLRHYMADAGYSNITTYIQSGNIVFTATEKNKEKIAKAIEELIENKFGFKIYVFVLGDKDLLKVAANNPYAEMNVTEAGPKKLYVTFLSDIPARENMESLYESSTSGDLISSTDTVLYFKLAGKASDSKLSNSFIENKLKIKATTRNWNTTVKLLALLDKL